nr:hypothetical protein [Methylobacterium sp. L1A1]
MLGQVEYYLTEQAVGMKGAQDASDFGVAGEALATPGRSETHNSVPVVAVRRRGPAEDGERPWTFGDEGDDERGVG